MNDQDEYPFAPQRAGPQSGKSSGPILQLTIPKGNPFTPKCNTQVAPESAIMPGGRNGSKNSASKTESRPSYSALVAAEGRPEAVNTESGEPTGEPDTKPTILICHADQDATDFALWSSRTA
jgi:hypothetical protein